MELVKSIDLCFGIGRFNNGTNYYKGKVYEIIMFNRDLKDEERLSIEEYLGKKYAIKMTKT